MRPSLSKVFATGFVRCVGEVIGLIVAETPEAALRAAQKVRVDIAPLPDEVVRFEEGILSENFFPFNHKIVKKSTDAVASTNTETYTDAVMTGGQHHWYLEPHALLVVPVENDEMVVYSCTQCVMKTQNAVSGVLGIPISNVNVIVRRIGGGFGGSKLMTQR